VPELPEVETVRRELEPWLTGRRIVRASRVEAPPGPKYAELERAAGQRIEGVTRRGKFLLLPLSRGDELVVHLGMTGAVLREPPAGHVRARLDLDKGEALYFQDARRFGRFLVVRAGDYAALPTLRALGPEPLDPAFTAALFASRLAGRRTSIKAAIMGQRVVAGVGNIYSDEALFRVRIHPATEAARLSRRQVARLRDAIVEVLFESLESGGTTFRDYRNVAGGEGRFVARLAVYGREGEPCLRCGRSIVRIVLAQRGTWYCPRCQRG
jgi:formamidopyrimidine-DNA glycosylase